LPGWPSSSSSSSSAYELYPRPAAPPGPVEAPPKHAGPGVSGGLGRGASAANRANPFNEILAAAGTNSLERFFPRLEIPAGNDTNRFILNTLQRDALGRIKLGLDLQGGMSFLVQMQTNEFKDSDALQRALDQAVEILRRRVAASAWPNLDRNPARTASRSRCRAYRCRKEDAKRQIEGGVP
jgi:hypothetical protein